MCHINKGTALKGGAQKKGSIMKITKPLVILATGFLLCWAGQTKAEYQTVGDDGIAASPKLRQILNERKASQAAMGAADVPDQPIVGRSEIVASPKVQA